MRLLEHPDFADIIEEATQDLRASRWPRISTAIVEKDYYVTEVLRVCAAHFGERVLFKGGTSLSKGWGLIQRFSEDVDLAILASHFTPPLSRSKTKKELGALASEVAEHTALGWRVLAEDGDFFRKDSFGYVPQASVAAEMAPEVLLEAGSRSGDFPVATVALSSLVGDTVRARGVEGIAEDLAPFEMQLLHFRRTFLEKLFALHDSIEKHLLKGAPIGTSVRHYYDVAQLAAAPEVREMLESDEADTIRDDYKSNCEKHFKHQILPPDMRLRDSRALFPPAELRRDLARVYAQQCGALCFTDTWPSFDEVTGMLEVLRTLL